MSHSIIVLPDDSARPVLEAINGATKSLRIKMFVFSDPEVLKAVIAAQKRGVKVQVMLNPARRSGEADNEETRARLTEGGVEVLDSNPTFDLTHEKSMVVDDTDAFVKSLNWATENFTETRDYAVVTSRESEVKEITDCFEADWSRESFDPGARSHQRAGSDCRIHRRRKAFPVHPERALPGPHHHRAPGASCAPRREGSSHGPPAAYAQEGKAH